MRLVKKKKQNEKVCANQPEPPKTQKESISVYVASPSQSHKSHSARSTRFFSGPNRAFGSCWRDPIAQSFMVDVPGGIFVPSVDLYFATKSTTMPVTVELRTMVNGYPTREVIPFGQVNKAASDISVSSDATTATTFTFPSPVYLQPQQEYCFVVLTNTDALYNLYCKIRAKNIRRFKIDF